MSIIQSKPTTLDISIDLPRRVRFSEVGFNVKFKPCTFNVVSPLQLNQGKLALILAARPLTTINEVSISKSLIA
jgi:hypothetical protein